MKEPETTQEAFDNLNKAFKDLKSETVDKFGSWYFRFFGRLAIPLYVILSLVSMAYVLTSFYLTLNQTPEPILY